jgi:hypothetical protein
MLSIVEVPTQEQVNDPTDEVSNAWLDDLKSYSLLAQKSNIEAIKLAKKYDIKK